MRNYFRALEKPLDGWIVSTASFLAGIGGSRQNIDGNLFQIFMVSIRMELVVVLYVLTVNHIKESTKKKTTVSPKNNHLITLIFI